MVLLLVAAGLALLVDGSGLFACCLAALAIVQAQQNVGC